MDMVLRALFQGEVLETCSVTACSNRGRIITRLTRLQVTVVTLQIIVLGFLFFINQTVFAGKRPQVDSSQRTMTAFLQVKKRLFEEDKNEGDKNDEGDKNKDGQYEDDKNVDDKNQADKNKDGKNYVDKNAQFELVVCLVKLNNICASVGHSYLYC